MSFKIIILTRKSRTSAVHTAIPMSFSFTNHHPYRRVGSRNEISFLLSRTIKHEEMLAEGNKVLQIEMRLSDY